MYTYMINSVCICVYVYIYIYTWNVEPKNETESL